jgi:hypothetical protein
MRLWQKLTLGLALLLLAAIGLQAATINVLWYTGGVEANAPGQYKSTFSALAATNPGGNAWNITYWDSGAMPAGTFNVLVVVSQEGGWSANPNYTALTSSPLTEASFGNRVMITGQDADWHYINGPGSVNFDGPRGFLTDSINWAGSGTGMGAVVLSADLFIAKFGGLGTELGGTEDVRIPAEFTGFPINGGLTSAGLSNWGTSAHSSWTGTDLTKWTPINANGGTCSSSLPSPPVASCTAFVTLVKSAEAGGGTTPTVPEPLTLVLLGPAFAGLAIARLRRKA